MAAENTKRILNAASKKASRVKEKLAQRILHVDGTTDQGIEMFVTNFNKQQVAVKKLQKELQKYTAAIKGLSGAAKSLSEVLVEVYEAEWEGSEPFKNFAEQRNLLYDDVLNSLNADVVTPVNDYLGKFPEAQKKIEKRERKLIDHDMTKREFEKVKTKDASKAKGQDQKLQHAEDKYTQAKQLYDEITDELYKELPDLYDSRIEFVAKLYDALSRHELQFHSQVSQIEDKILQLTAKLLEEAAMGTHSTKRERDAGPPQPNYQDTTSEGGGSSIIEQAVVEGTAPVTSDTTQPSPAAIGGEPSGGELGGGEPAPTTPTPVTQSPTRSPSHSKEEPASKAAPSEPTTPTAVQSQGQVRPPKPVRVSSASIGDQRQEQSPDRNSVEVVAPPSSTTVPVPAKQNVPEVPAAVVESGEEEAAESNAKGDDKIEDTSGPVGGAVNSMNVSTKAEEPTVVPPDATAATNHTPSDVTTLATPPLPPPDLVAAADGKGEQIQEAPQGEEPVTVLYKVIATHPYKGEDEDELAFEKGTVIMVIPYENPEDEDAGWKMGYISATKAKGVFPENFTKPFH